MVEGLGALGVQSSFLSDLDGFSFGLFFISPDRGLNFVECSVVKLGEARIVDEGLLGLCIPDFFFKGSRSFLLK